MDELIDGFGHDIVDQVLLDFCCDFEIVIFTLFHYAFVSVLAVPQQLRQVIPYD